MYREIQGQVPSPLWAPWALCPISWCQQPKLSRGPSSKEVQVAQAHTQCWLSHNPAESYRCFSMKVDRAIAGNYVGATPLVVFLVNQWAAVPNRSGPDPPHNPSGTTATVASQT